MTKLAPEWVRTNDPVTEAQHATAGLRRPPSQVWRNKWPHLWLPHLLTPRRSTRQWHDHLQSFGMTHRLWLMNLSLLTYTSCELSLHSISRLFLFTYCVTGHLLAFSAFNNSQRLGRAYITITISITHFLCSVCYRFCCHWLITNKR